ncbi:DUF2341 domain-containing protein, partial [Flavobacteriales bacterium]|nr:DUF2341 domain-containing protein [Flavobacteriales bacterium]
LSGLTGGGGGPYSYSIGNVLDSLFIDVTSDPLLIDSLASGTFDIVVLDQFGCQSSAYTETITEPSAITINSLNVTDVVGCGSSGTGSIAVTASGGTGTLNYYLNNGINSPATSGNWPALSGGSYEVMVQDAEGCQTLTAAQINAPWTVSAGNDVYQCGSGNATLGGEIIGALPTDCTPVCSSGCGMPIGYCGANGATSSTYYMWIRRVRFNEINRTSGSNGYANYTNDNTTVNRGATYEFYTRIRKRAGYCMYTTVFFDWNRDGDFTDSGERYNLNYGCNTTQNIYQNITIPLGASLGTTRMRVRSTYYWPTYGYPNPCGNLNYGEVEDYSVTIIGTPTTCTPSYSWTSGGGSNLIGSVTPSSTTNYTLTVDDGAGCVQNDQVTVNVSNETTSTSLQNVDCFGNTNGCVTLNPTNGIQPYLMYGPSNTVQVYGGSMRPISINNSTSAASNLPVKMTIPYSASMRADFGDIRFYDSNQAKLNYWIESISLSSSAIVWVKIPSLPGGNSTIYMTYGNNSLTTESQGDDVFEFFDNFNSFDATKWTQGTIAATSGTNWSYYGGVLIGGNTNRFQSSTATFTGSRISEARTYESSSPVNGFSNIGFWSSTSNAYNVLSHNGTNYVREDAGWPNFGGWGTGQRNTWMREYVRANGASSRVERTRESLGGTIGQDHNNSGLSGERIRLGARGDNVPYNQNFAAEWDWMLVRPYISAEPTITLGTIQTSDNQFCGFAPGTYNFNVLDVAGCNNALSPTITQPAAALTLSFSMYEQGCYNVDGEIDLTVAGGTPLSASPPPYYYTWAGPSGFSASTEDLAALQSGVYNITVADDNACTGNGTATLLQLTPINSPGYTWTGNTNTLWQIEDNWDCRLPDATSEVIIPGSPIGGNNPEIRIGIIGDVYNIDIRGNTSNLLDIQDGGLLRIHEP